jgi:ribose 5-phosphate isomerase B
MSDGDLQKRTIHLATDHAGFDHKEAVKSWLLTKSYQVVDHGAQVVDAGDDFPDFISLAAAAVSQAPESTCAIIFGGSGNGEAMMANRFLNVRAAVYYGGDPTIVELSREHNDANVLSIGARFVSIEDTKEVISTWLQTTVLPEEKRTRRNKKIEAITKSIRTA